MSGNNLVLILYFVEITKLENRILGKRIKYNEEEFPILVQPSNYTRVRLILTPVR